MDITTLKSDFYKRFDTSDNMLITQKSGILCTLLGFCDIRGSTALSAPLSMGVTGVCRRLDGGAVKITDTSNGDVMTYYLSNFPLGQNFCGAQLLLDNAVPGYIDSTAAMRTCAIKCIMRVNGIDEFDKISACAVSCGKGNIKPYLALLEAKRGYAVFSHKLNTSLVPLPMTGYKYVLIQFSDKKFRTSSKDVERALNIISNAFPHVTTFADLNSETLRYASSVLKSRKTVRRISYLMNETKRISCAVTVLKSMHTEALFDIINESAREYTILWDSNKEISTLLDFAASCDGVMAARPFENGIVCIVDENMSDHITSAFLQHLKYCLKNNIRFCISK